MWSTLIPIIGEIVLEGMQMWSEERRTRFMDDYHDILTKLEKARSRSADTWVDSDIDIAQRDLEIFLKAYSSEVKSENATSSN